MSKGFEFKIVEAHQIKPYVEELRQLEAGISYPLDDGNDQFFIDHGPTYHRFFSGMGSARFLVVEDAKGVCGVMAGVWRTLSLAGEDVEALYLADLKLAPRVRGQGVVVRMLWHGIRSLFAQVELRGWRIVYGAAMRGAKGDVMRSMKGSLHPAGLLDFEATTHLYFIDPVELVAKLPLSAPSNLVMPYKLANFGPTKQELIHDTQGEKDFMLASTNAPWNLVHLDQSPARWTSGFATYLREAALWAAAHHPGALACFALDPSLRDHHQWLAQHGVEPGATCTIYAMQVRGMGGPQLTQMDAIHVATSTI